jgi:hypothetical protein
MAIKAGVGWGKQDDAYQAGNDACATALRSGGITQADMLIVFSSVALNQEEMLRGVRAAGGNAQLIGCTDAGEITSEGPSEQAVAVMAIESDSVTFTTGIEGNVKADARAAGRTLAQAVHKNAPDELRAFIMLPDVLVGNGAEIVRGIQEALGEHFPIVGGAAGDDFKFEKTYQYEGERVMSGAVAGVGLSGTFVMGAGVRHGWVPIGMPLRATRSKGAVLYELDHKPAVSIYEDYFGEKASRLKEEPLARMAITYPLGVKVEGLDEYLIRDPITVGEDGSITCAAEIPEGAEIRLMIGSKDKAVEAAQAAARKFMDDFESQGAQPKLALMFNCIAREKLFGKEAFEEISAVMEIIGRDVPLLGFYTYGEQAPIAGETRDHDKISSRFYNETIVLFGIGE